MPDWNEKNGNGQTVENGEGVKDYVWQRQKTIPLCDKGAKEPEGSSLIDTRALKVRVHHKDEVDLKSNYEVHKYKVTE